jgi:hypothetical protein
MDRRVRLSFLRGPLYLNVNQGAPSPWNVAMNVER